MKWLRITLEDTVNQLWGLTLPKVRTSKNYESLVQTFSTKTLSNGLQKEKTFFYFFLFSFCCPSCWGSFIKGKRRGHGPNYSTDRLFLPINIFFDHHPLVTCWKYKASNKPLIRNKGLDFPFEYKFCEEEHNK